MSGIKYLLDTNYILGILQSNQEVLSDAMIAATALVTKIELLTLDHRLKFVVSNTPSLRLKA